MNVAVACDTCYHMLCMLSHAVRAVTAAAAELVF